MSRSPWLRSIRRRSGFAQWPAAHRLRRGAGRSHRPAARAKADRVARGCAPHRARDQEPAHSAGACRPSAFAATWSAATPPDAASLRVIRQCAITISSSVETVRKLVDEFSTLARFPASKPQPSDINAIVNEALLMFDGRLDDIQVRRFLATDLPHGAGRSRSHEARGRQPGRQCRRGHARFADEGDRHLHRV